MRILFVATAASIHAARWISQLKDCGWDLHLFDSVDGPIICSELSNATLYRGWYAPAPLGVNVHYRWPFPRGNQLLPHYFPGLAKWIVPDSVTRLAQVVRRIQPDCIHAMSMTHAVYTLFNSLQHLGDEQTPWVYSSWGSDFFYFGQQPEHAERIGQILPKCRYYISNNRRDVRLAYEFGFTGEVMGIFPGPGGYPIGRMRALRQPGPVSARRIIAIKGFHNFAGRALVALEAIERCAQELGGYTVMVYSPHPPVVGKIESIRSSLNIPIETIPGRHNPQRTIWELLGRSRIHIGVSATDGIPNTMLEAMVMGAFPIQTNPGGVTEEWVEDGINGFLVPDDDPDQVAEAILRAITDDQLVDHADAINGQATLERLDLAVVRPRVIGIYEHIVQARSQFR